jgi:hypothetical protein
MSKRGWIRGILTAAFGLIVCGFAAKSARGDDASPRQAKLNGGYYLLHTLADNEAQLPILLDLKTAPREVQTFADHISKLGKETEGDIEKMSDHDPALRYDKNPLPEIEQETRDSIKDDKQHMLLFGTKGPEFVRALINSQIEATTYAINLSKVLADQESSPDRARTLRHLSAKWLKMRKDAFRILCD